MGPLKNRAAGFLMRFFSLLFAAVPAFAQLTTVSGTVTDSASIPYANGTIKAQLVTTAGSPVSGQPTVTVNNQAQCVSGGFGSAPCQVPFQGTVGPFGLSAAGTFTVNLQDNTQVTPAATQWLFTVNTVGEPLPVGTGPQVCSAQLTISGASQSVTASFSACPRLSNVGGGGGGTGTVTSVGLTAPPQYNITGSPVTVSGTLGVNWNAVSANAALMGPCPTCINGILDGTSLNTGNSITATASLTPTVANDFVWMIFAGDFNVGQASPTTMPAGWTSRFTDGNGAGAFSQQFAGTSTINAVATFSTSANNWADMLVALKTNGTPTIVQTNASSGSITNGVSVPFPGSLTLGNSVLVVLVGQPNAAVGSILSALVYDSQGNAYTSLGQIQNAGGGGEGVQAWLTTKVRAAADTVTIQINGTGSPGYAGAALEVFELSNILAPSTTQPAFRQIQTADLPAVVAGPTVRVVCTRQTLGGTVTISNVSATTIMSVTCTSPATGCPCRALANYFINTSTNTNPTTDFWVSDGTNTFAGSQVNTSTGVQAGNNGFDVSPVTYASNTSLTFTLFAETTANTTSAVVSPQVNGPSSTFQVVFVTSN